MEGVQPAAVPLNRSVIFSACLARTHLKSSTLGFPVAYEYVEFVKWARLPWVEFKVTAIGAKEDMGRAEKVKGLIQTQKPGVGYKSNFWQLAK